MKKHIFKQGGEKCPKCDRFMQRRAHADITKQLKQNYYFSQWDVCSSCHHIQHYEKYKVKKENMKGTNENI